MLEGLSTGCIFADQMDDAVAGRVSPYLAQGPSGTIPTMESTTVTISVLNITPVSRTSKLLALADVEIVIDGVALVVHGVQVKADGSGAEIRLPTFRASSGEWISAISLPDEVRGPMGDVVIAAGVDAGILKERAEA